MERPQCCPQGSFVSEWEITFTGYEVEGQYNDGKIRFENGTVHNDSRISDLGQYRSLQYTADMLKALDKSSFVGKNDLVDQDLLEWSR